MDRLSATRLSGPVDLIVELASNEGETRDRQKKLAEYELSLWGPES